jgi:hypothetical protein
MPAQAQAWHPGPLDEHDNIRVAAARPKTLPLPAAPLRVGGGWATIGKLPLATATRSVMGRAGADFTGVLRVRDPSVM